VHGAYYDRDKMPDPNEAKTAPLLEATTTLEIAQQLQLYGAPDHVVVQTIMTPSNDIYWLTMKDAADWGAIPHNPPRIEHSRCDASPI
jgi:hypothetical protein